MSNSTYFVRECPTCGRRLQIRVEYLGKKVACQHCQGQFVAFDPSGSHGDCVEQSKTLLRRADELLESVVLQDAEVRPPYPR